ncbi:MAG: PAS domain S-box protein [Deltaproteobacteria bacterium]|nr:PAS domain S-box protein [Deltaproteobacteria bacterium]
MDIVQKKAFKNRVDSLKRENKKLSEKLAVLRKEKQLVQRDLRDAHRLLAEIPGPVILVQGQNIVFTNEMTWNLLGYTEEELLSHELFDLVHPRSSEYVRTTVQKLSSGKPVPDQFEVYMRRKNGTSLCFEAHWKKIRYHGRTAFLYNMTRLDQRKKEEKKSSQSQKIKAIARMASWLSRDFEKGFKIVDAHFSEFLGMESVVDKKVIRSLRRLEAGMEIGNHISLRLNCLTRLENDPSVIALFDPKKIVKDAVAITRPLWKEDSHAQITVKTYLRTLSPVEGYAEEIRDAFVNMILNAIDAMPGGGEIYLTTEEDSGFARIYIQDGGTGISEEIKDKIFDPFFSTKGGRGLGLSLAYAIITRHGGEIELISQEGQGATFIVKLPLFQKPAASSKAKRGKNRIRDSRILFVSAGSIASDLLTQEFVSKGGKVTTVYSCMEGLKLLRRKIFDLIVTDIDTPDFEVANIVDKIKKIKRGVPIVLLNAGENGRPTNTLKKLGADLIIERPLEMGRITSLISETITMND